jgi:hypothetical protein
MRTVSRSWHLERLRPLSAVMLLGFAWSKWSEWDLTIVGADVRTRELSVYVGPWCWVWEWREVDDWDDKS